jgi:TonB family protein
VRILADVGSDGRIRRTVIADSSGDAAVDAAAATALAAFRFEAPTAHCVSASTTWPQTWLIPAEALVPPASLEPGATPVPVQCVAPFVRALGFPVPRRREVPGTATIDVGFDANARVSTVHLARSSGNRKTDYAATVAARNGSYMLARQRNCPHTTTTYRLEFTFR